MSSVMIRRAVLLNSLPLVQMAGVVQWYSGPAVRSGNAPVQLLMWTPSNPVCHVSCALYLHMSHNTTLKQQQGRSQGQSFLLVFVAEHISLLPLEPTLLPASWALCGRNVKQKSWRLSHVSELAFLALGWHSTLNPNPLTLGSNLRRGRLASAASTKS